VRSKAIHQGLYSSHSDTGKAFGSRPFFVGWAVLVVIVVVVVVVVDVESSVVSDEYSDRAAS
jgi:hypothetical protein